MLLLLLLYYSIILCDECANLGKRVLWYAHNHFLWTICYCIPAFYYWTLVGHLSARITTQNNNNNNDNIIFDAPRTRDECSCGDLFRILTDAFPLLHAAHEHTRSKLMLLSAAPRARKSRYEYQCLICIYSSPLGVYTPLPYTSARYTTCYTVTYICGIYQPYPYYTATPYRTVYACAQHDNIIILLCAIYAYV